MMLVGWLVGCCGLLGIVVYESNLTDRLKNPVGNLVNEFDSDSHAVPGFIRRNTTQTKTKPAQPS